MKKRRILLIIVLPIALVGMLLVYPWAFIHLGILLSPSPPAPLNTYSEFPFRIVYEVDEERYTIEDVLVCEYIGRGVDDMRGKHLKWDVKVENKDLLICGFMSSFPESGNEWKYGCAIKLLDRVDIGDGVIGGVYVDIGGAPYYLGYYTLEGYNPGSGLNNRQGLLSEDVLWEQYKIRIIKTEFFEPMIGNGIDITQ